jgi:hypothetical protein
LNRLQRRLPSKCRGSRGKDCTRCKSGTSLKPLLGS